MKVNTMKKHTFTALILASTVLSAAAYAECDKKNHKKGHKNHGAKQFMMIDKDDDGKLSKEEMQTFHESRFTKMDADGDGFVTKEEMKANHKANRKERKRDLKKSDDE